MATYLINDLRISPRTIHNTAEPQPVEAATQYKGGNTKMTTPDAMVPGGTDLREGYAEVGEVKLHYVEAGDGPLIVLLHGFPEFWFGWRLQIEPLVAAGFPG